MLQVTKHKNKSVTDFIYICNTANLIPLKKFWPSSVDLGYTETTVTQHISKLNIGILSLRCCLFIFSCYALL